MRKAFQQFYLRSLFAKGALGWLGLAQAVLLDRIDSKNLQRITWTKPQLRTR
jgi:hypothetical protein